MTETALRQLDVRTPDQGIHVPDEIVDEVHNLYTRSLNLKAYAVSQTVGPLAQWTGTRARIMAGRLANNLGGGRLGTLHHLRAWQADPTDPSAAYYYAYALLGLRGPYPAWQFMLKTPAPSPEANATAAADWLALQGSIAAMFRDFGRADPLSRQALELAPERPWLWVERSMVLHRQDQLEDALEAARRSLELRAWFRPGVQEVAHLLIILNRDEEGLDLLEQAARHTESGPIVGQLAATLTERKRYAEAREQWDRLIDLSPMADRHFKRMLACRRSDAAYFCGDVTSAASIARDAGPGFFAQIASRLAEDLEGKRRVELPVPFVAQHHKTCAPATLSALSRFWGRPAEHLEIVEAICHDGTPAHSERAWAEQNGYVAREFRVTWDVAVALIDRGVPFTLTTTEVTSAHLQAIVGYDARRHTLLLRDPGSKFTGEVLADGLGELYASTGPRGMTLVPADRGELLAGIDLPEAALYDQFHAVQTALVAHRRDEAAAAHAAMVASDPNHRLTYWAQRSLASYDADPLDMLAATDALLRLYPDDPALRLHRLGLLGNFARRSEILEELRSICRGPKRHPVFLQRYAQELAADTQETPRAARLLRRYQRMNPMDPTACLGLADQLWYLCEYEEAVELYRLGTCLNDRDDRLSSVYFSAARYLKRTDDALALLTDRFERYAGKSGGPARALFHALMSIDRSTEAFDVLERGLARRPDDGELLLHAADAYARYGKFDRAAALLDQAAGRVHAAQHLRARAALANYRGELPVALARWQEVLADEPLAYDAHEAVARLLAETQGRDVALRHLAESAARFEHHYPLHRLWISWLRGEDPAQTEAVVRRLLTARPGDAWLLRELAICQLRQGRAAEAVSAAERARELDPNNRSSHVIAGHTYAASGRVADAMQSYRAALRLSIDDEEAMGEMIALCTTVAQRGEAVAFICEELVRQVTFGEGLLAYYRFAAGTLDGEEALKTLADALAARPDLWHAWSANIRQLADMNRIDEAQALARRAVERFPLLARLWLDLALVQGLGGDHAGEVASLHQALELSPGWGVAVRQLAAAYCRDAQFDDARKLLEGAIGWNPLDALNFGHLAHVQWRAGDRPAALESLRKALRLAPGYEWAWGMLKQWGSEANEPDAAVAMARELTTRRAGEANAWFTLARMIEAGPDTLDERLSALDRATALEPLNSDQYDFRAVLLANAKRFDEALAACQPPAMGAVPIHLKGRAAWVVWARGDVAQAIADMTAVVAEDPRYVWGWSMLAKWHRDADAHQAYLDATAQLVRLSPLDASAWAHLGEAQERLRDKAAALQSFARAVELDPADRFAAFSLFDLQLETDPDAAGRTLEAIARHERGGLIVARQVQWRCKTGDRAQAVAALRDLCTQPDLEPYMVGGAFDAMADAGWAAIAEKELEQALWLAGTQPAVADEWVRRIAVGKDWDKIERVVERLLAAGPDPSTGRETELCRRAYCAYLQQLGLARQKARVLQFAKRHMAEIAANDVYWGMVGAALTDCRAYARVVRWLSGWRSRPEIKPWMVSNLCESLHALRRYPEFRETLQAALALEPDHTIGVFRTWQALDYACSGRPVEARTALAEVDERSLDESHHFLFRVTSLLAKADDGDAKAAYRRARRDLTAIETAFPKFREDLSKRTIHRRAVAEIARRRGGLPARIWSLVKR